MTRTCGLNAGPPVLRPADSVWSHPRGGYAAMGTRGCLGVRLLQGRSHDVRSRLQLVRPGRRLRGEMTTVLITQCLQRDFVDPIGPHDPLPNLLHVGYSESTRLLGPEPAAGPRAPSTSSTSATGTTRTTPPSASTCSSSARIALRAPAERGSSWAWM